MRLQQNTGGDDDEPCTSGRGEDEETWGRRTAGGGGGRGEGKNDGGRVYAQRGRKDRPFSGATPLALAAWKGDPATVELLLDFHADINARNDNGETPLCIAAYNGHVEVVRLLLARGARIDVPDNDGLLPLTRAMQRENNAEIASLLLEETKKRRDGSS